MESIVLGSFGVLCFVALVLKKFSSSSPSEEKEKPAKKVEVESQESRFKKLQWKFFSAYFLAILGDWLQGPYVYKVFY